MSSLNGLSSRSESPSTREGLLNHNFAYRGRPAIITSAYEGASSFVSGAAKKVQESAVAKVLQKPGVYLPLAAGGVFTAACAGVAPAMTGMANLAALATGKEMCSASVVDTVSIVGIVGGVLGTVVGLVSSGEVATTDAEMYAGIAGKLAVIGSFGGQMYTMISQGPPVDDSFLCVAAQIPALNLVLGGGAAGLVGGTGVALYQGYYFCRSAARVADEERGSNELQSL